MELEHATPEDDEDAPVSSNGARTPENEEGPVDFERDKLEIPWEPGPRMTTVLKAHYDGKLFHSDSLNLAKSETRKKFVKEVVRKAETQLKVKIPAEAIETRLMKVADKIDALKDEEAGEEVGEAAYEMVESDDPGRTGIYRLAGDQSFRLTNFTARIDEDVLILDEGRESSRRFVGHTWLDGQRRPFALSATDYVNNERLQAALTTSAGSGAVFLDPKIPKVRAAIGLAGREPRAGRVVTTDHGWHGTGKELRYLTLNGYVDADGFHDYPDDPSFLRVELHGVDVASRLGLRRLDREALIETGRHVVEDYLRLHGRPVMFTLLGTAATAVLAPFAAHDQRFSVWLKGLTGAGKSHVAKTTLGFFGDFDPCSGRQFVSWAWTPNTIEKAGYSFRGAIFLVDDFKLELMRNKGDAIRILQLYADDQGRGRLFSDTRSAPVWPIRGLLLATGEDVPQNSASALGRMIMVEVPNRPKDLERGRRCRERRREYAGLMADFIAHLIRERRTERFKERVEQCTEVYYQDIAGQANDARIAWNFGFLAAATDEFAAYLGHLGVWPGWEQERKEYQDQDLITIRNTMLRLVGNERAAAIFLSELRNLVAVRSVRLRGWPPREIDKDERTPLIGRVEGGQVEIVPELAMAEVQRSLRAQGRPELAVTRETLLEQLVEQGILLNRQGAMIKPADTGRRVYQQRILGDGSKPYVAAFPGSILGIGDSKEDHP